MASGTTGGAELPCRDVVELVTAYLEGALDAPTVAAIEAHLQLCAGCREYLEQLRTTVALVRGVETDSLPEETRQQILAMFRDFRPPAA